MEYLENVEYLSVKCAHMSGNDVFFIGINVSSSNETTPAVPPMIIPPSDTWRDSMRKGDHVVELCTYVFFLIILWWCV